MGGGGVTADMVNAATPEVVAGSNGQVQVQFTITVPVGSPSIALTPESARQKLASVDMSKFISDLQSNLDTASGTPGQYQLDAADGSEVESSANGKVAHTAVVTSGL